MLGSIEAMVSAAETAAKKRIGCGWSVLSAEMKEAFICREAMSIIAQNEDNAGWQRAALLATKILTL
jgi:superoxide dismutase